MFFLSYQNQNNAKLVVNAFEYCFNTVEYINSILQFLIPNDKIFKCFQDFKYFPGNFVKLNIFFVNKLMWTRGRDKGHSHTSSF